MVRQSPSSAAQGEPTAPEQAAIAYLRSPTAIRERCGLLFARSCEDRLPHFRCDLTQLDRVTDYVLAVTQDTYPDWNIPFHSRWRHFEVGGIPRLAALDLVLQDLTPLERVQAKLDLTTVSVLLDAGAGDRWQYAEAETGQHWQRSEGLAVASLRMFCRGVFSSDPNQPLQVDATRLTMLDQATLAAGLQASVANPLVGLNGRLQLLQRLGQALHSFPHLFGQQPPRPGNLVHYCLQQAHEKMLPAETVFEAVLLGLGPIWPGRLAIANINLGDVWPHPALAGEHPAGGLVPFHKLSQWLTYSLLEPLQELGLQITDLDALTGLAEYRNGGLCLDLGLLQIKDSTILQTQHPVDSAVVVEWRALTILLLDQIATAARQKLGLNAEELPLVKVLQGGTWSAGRKLARALRSGGVPPIPIDSDGTVF